MKKLGLMNKTFEVSKSCYFEFRVSQATIEIKSKMQIHFKELLAGHAVCTKTLDMLKN